jgi:hypothetical protein
MSPLVFISFTRGMYLEDVWESLTKGVLQIVVVRLIVVNIVRPVRFVFLNALCGRSC